jgi:hypothetical protein
MTVFACLLIVGVADLRRVRIAGRVTAGRVQRTRR